MTIIYLPARNPGLIQSLQDSKFFFPLTACFRGRSAPPWKIPSCFYTGFLWPQHLPIEVLQSILRSAWAGSGCCAAAGLSPVRLQAARAAQWSGGPEHIWGSMQVTSRPLPCQPCPHCCDIHPQSTGLSRHTACKTTCKYLW